MLVKSGTPPPISNKLENVQKFACKLAFWQWDAGYQELIELLTLEKRRFELKLGLLFKILHDLSISTLRHYCPSRNAHCLQIICPLCSQ